MSVFAFDLIKSPYMYGRESAIRRLSHICPQIPILVFDRLGKEKSVFAAIQAGAKGWPQTDHRGSTAQWPLQSPGPGLQR